MGPIADLCNDFGERRIDSLFPLVVSDGKWRTVQYFPHRVLMSALPVARERNFNKVFFDKLYPATAINRFVEDHERDGVCDMAQEEKEKWLQHQEAELGKLKKVRAQWDEEHGYEFLTVSA